jgi:tetratricopeptide (TPR) repeat protein
MGIGDWFKRKGAKPGPRPPGIRRPDELITAFDDRGRELKIRRSDWADSILLPNLEKVWSDPEALAAAITQALEDDFPELVAAAAARLVDLEDESERSLIVAAVVSLELDDLAAAERSLRRSVDKHGESALVLTNLAKVLDGRGDKPGAATTLRRALALAPNVENALLWWAAMAREERGDAAYLAALEEISSAAGAWRARLWIAREKLGEGDRAAAVALYEEALARAGDEPEALTMVSGDLGNAGALEEIVRLVGRRYDPGVHGPYAGLNLLRAQKELGRIEDARALLRRLQGMGWHPFAATLAQIDGELAAGEGPRPATSPPEIVTLSLSAPLWTRGMDEPDWLLPAARREAPVVALATFSSEVVPARQAQIQAADAPGRLTRALPLFVAEALQLKYGLRVHCSILVAKGAGPVVMGSALDPQTLEAILPDASGPQLLVNGRVLPGGVRLDLWERGQGGTPETLSVEAPLVDPGRLAAAVERALGEALARRRILPAVEEVGALYREPPAELLARYVSALEQLLYQILVANGHAPADSLFNERGFFETYFGLAEDWPDPPDAVRLIAISGVLAGARYGSAILPPYKKLVLDWIDLAPPGSAIDRLAPVLLRRLGEERRRASWAARRRPAAGAAYATWLERVTAGAAGAPRS